MAQTLLPLDFKWRFPPAWAFRGNSSCNEKHSEATPEAKWERKCSCSWPLLWVWSQISEVPKRKNLVLTFSNFKKKKQSTKMESQKKQKSSAHDLVPKLAAQTLAAWLQHFCSEPLFQFQHFWPEPAQQQHWQHALALAASRAWNTSCVEEDIEAMWHVDFCDVLTTTCSIHQEICNR